MKSLTVTEYEPIALGPKFATYPKTLTRAHADSVLRYAEGRGLELLEYINSRSVRPKNYVGVIAVGDVVLEVLPKIEDAMDAPRMRHNLLAMLCAALELDVRESELSGLATQCRTLLDFIAALYCRHLLQLARQGLVKSYIETDDDLPVLRGKLLATRQFTRNAVHPERLACRYSVFTADTVLNRALKSALLRVRALIQGVEAQRLVGELLFIFDDVGNDVDLEAVSRLTLDRTNQRYSPVLKLAQLILRGESPDVTRGSTVSYALVFDMNELFERYIGAKMRRAAQLAGIRARLQARGFFLARETTVATRAFALIPDILVMSGAATLGVVDTKWKRLTPSAPRFGVTPSDMYQMVAYARGLSCPRIVLLYPHHGGLEKAPGKLLNYALEPDNDVQVTIETVDLSDIAEVLGQCQAIVQRLSESYNARPPQAQAA